MDTGGSDALNFQSLLEAIESPVCIVDRDFKLVAGNKAREKATGIANELTFGRSIFEVFPDNPNDPTANGVANLTASMKRVLQNKASDQMPIQKYDVPVRDATDGSFEVRYWSPVNSPLFDANGEVTHILHRVEDVTDRISNERSQSELTAEVSKQTELQKLTAAKEANAREIANRLPMMVWTARPDGYVDWYNDWWYEYLGGAKKWDDVDGQPMHPDDVERTTRLWDESRRTGVFFTMEQRFRRASDGMYRWHLVRGVPVRDHDGMITKWIGGNTDIHDAKVLSQQLQESRALAELANDTKTAFLANMSHEIRTPLTAILGFSAILKDRSIDPAVRDQYVDTIVRNGTSLSRIIDDILDLAKVEAGKLDVENVPFSLYDLASDTVDLFKDKTKAKNIYLLLNIDKAVPVQICSDPTRLRQIMVNLIGNAVKFTETGGVRVNISMAPVGERKIRVCVDVKDTGIGLAPGQKEKLFAPFMQADNSTTRKFGGTGLGLALSQRLSHAMSGDISIIESDLGLGCTFRLSFVTDLPVDTSVKKDVTMADEALSLAGYQILVVDDSLDNQFLVAHLLKKAGAKVDTSSDGEEGYHQALSKIYDVILMDIQMPKMDGYQAKRALDDCKYDRPIVALTAHAMSEERERTRKAGFAAHLTKPLIVGDLIKTVASFQRADAIAKT